MTWTFQGQKPNTKRFYWVEHIPIGIKSMKKESEFIGKAEPDWKQEGARLRTTSDSEYPDMVIGLVSKHSSFINCKSFQQLQQKHGGQ